MGLGLMTLVSPYDLSGGGGFDFGSPFEGYFVGPPQDSAASLLATYLDRVSFDQLVGERQEHQLQAQEHQALVAEAPAQPVTFTTVPAEVVTQNTQTAPPTFTATTPAQTTTPAQMSTPPNWELLALVGLAVFLLSSR